MRNLAKKLGRMPFLLQRVRVVRGADNPDFLRNDLPLLTFTLRGCQFALYYYRGAGGKALDFGVVRQAVSGDDSQASKSRSVIQLDEREIFRVAASPHPALNCNLRNRRG